MVIVEEKKKRTLFSLHEKKKILQEIDETSQENIESAHRYAHDSDIKYRTEFSLVFDSRRKNYYWTQ